jgi:hypothetical protein
MRNGNAAVIRPRAATGSWSQRPEGMPVSNQTFLAIVGAAILFLIGVVVVDKYQTCQAAQQGFDMCFRTNTRW